MSSGGSDHTRIIDKNVSGPQEDYREQKGTGDESMYYPDRMYNKDTRRRKMSRDAQYDRFGDKVKERKVKRPRNNKVKYYDYEQWE